MLTLNHAQLNELERFGGGRHRGVALHPLVKPIAIRRSARRGSASANNVCACSRLERMALQDWPGIHAEDVSKALIGRLLQLIHRIGLDVIGNHQSNP